MMSKKIESLKESPCYNCPMATQCENKIKRSPVVSVVRDYVYSKADYDFHNCGIYISLTTDDIIDES